MEIPTVDFRVLGNFCRECGGGGGRGLKSLILWFLEFSTLPLGKAENSPNSTFTFGTLFEGNVVGGDGSKTLICWFGEFPSSPLRYVCSQVMFFVIWGSASGRLGSKTK